jgi:hypothetical protein
MNPVKKQTDPKADDFLMLLHKKTMHKTGGAKRQMIKYYKDKYKKTGIIPEPLQLANQGIFEGRNCSGRQRVLLPEVIKRFSEMVKASADLEDTRFIFITQKARKIKSYQEWLEEEFECQLSFHALYRCAKRENLSEFLNKPDTEKKHKESTYFNSVKVFELIQVDGCEFQFIKIRDSQGQWKKPKVIEFFDTASRKLFCLGLYFSENNENSVNQLTIFLLSTPFPDRRIRIRPDQAQAFLNLQRPIQELNHKYSLRPGGFYMEPNFARARSPKDKVHLETSHRALHNFEILMIKYFQNKIVKQEPSILFMNSKKKEITVTYLDISIDDINNSNLLEKYRKRHNEKPHRFSHQGVTQRWIPEDKYQSEMKEMKTIQFDAEDINAFMRYGYLKKKATVSIEGTLIYDDRNMSLLQEENDLVDKKARRSRFLCVLEKY